MKKIILLLSIFLLNTSSKDNIYCDIKGNVNNPGVYEIKDNYTIKDIIKDAGGLKDRSYTDKINLSKKVVDEMVIYIPTKNEIYKLNTLNNCDCSRYVLECLSDSIDNDVNVRKEGNSVEKSDNVITNEVTTKNKISTTKKIVNTSKNINSKTTIITTTEKIINYPININSCSLEELLTIKGLGDIKAKKIIEYRDANGLFKSIEDIKNINGIGDALFNKIKEFITV